MVKSLLSPEKIIGNKNPKSSFGSLSGKNSLGSSVISKSSNKIVGFNRAKVSTNKGEVQKIVSNLTTNNIANSSNNIIKNIFGSLQAKQNKEEENKEKKFGIFGFFNSIKDAFNLIRFVGSKKNLDKIKDSLENLKITFSETFDVAKILRKIIKKIFDQLSGLSGDGGGGKGLWGLIAAAIASTIRKLFRGVVKTFSDIFERMSKNENTMRNIIDKIAPPPTPGPSVPSIGTAVTTVGGIATGSGLASLPAAGTATKALPAAGTATKALPAAGSATKALPEAKGAGNIFSKMPKKGKFGLIAAGLGLATLGGTSMMNKSGLSQPGGEDVQPGETAPEVPGNVLDRFNSILDRFDKILDGLRGGKGKKGSDSGTKPSGSGSGGGGSPTPTPPPGPNPPDTGAISGNQEQIESQMFDYLKQNYGENVAYGMLSNSMRESGYRTNAPEGGYFGMFQLDKIRKAKFREWAKSKNLDPMSNQAQLQYGVVEAQQLGTLDRMKAAKTPEDAASLFYNEFERAAYSKPIVGSAYTPDNPHELKNRKYLQQIRERQSKRIPGTVSGAPPAPALPSPTPQTQITPGQQAPPPTKPGQNKPAVIVLPGPQQQQQSPPSGGGGKISASPAPKQNGPTAPFYPSSNYDNFLTLYSRMVYNIVDG